MLKSVALLLCVAVITVSGDSRSNAQVDPLPVLTDAVVNGFTQDEIKSPKTDGVALENANVPSNVGSDTIINDTTAPPAATASDNHPKPDESGATKLPPPNNTTTASTEKPTSTTTPSTTTITPSTTTTTTTTQVPMTTTNAPSNVTTTPAPEPTTTPLPEPSTGKWIVNGTNITCIVVQMAVQMNVTYDTVNKMKAYKLFDIPGGNSTTATGTCGVMEQNITLSWNSTGTMKDNFTLHFVKNETTKQYALHHFEISLAPQDLPLYNSNNSMVLMHNVSQFSTGLSNSYRCFRSQTFNLTHNGTVMGQLKMTDLQFQAFRADNSTVFSLAKDCAFDTPDIVPIVVGCALAGLVIIVLVAYLVGRRRCQSRGYLSM